MIVINLVISEFLRAIARYIQEGNRSTDSDHQKSLQFASIEAGFCSNAHNYENFKSVGMPQCVNASPIVNRADNVHKAYSALSYMLLSSIGLCRYY